MSKGAGLISSIFIARILGSELFGQYGMIKNIILSTAVFATFGMAYSSTKFIADNQQSGYFLIKLVNKFLLYTFIFSVFFSLVIFINGEFISKTILKESNLGSSLKLATFIIILTAISTTQTGIIAGLGEFKKLATSNSIIGLFIIVLSIIFCYYFNLLGALVALAIIQIISIYFFFRIIENGLTSIEKSLKLDVKIRWKHIISSSFPIALQEGIYSVLYFLNFWIVVNYASYSELGIYSASMQWYSIILFIPGILRNVLLFHLTNSNNNNDVVSKSVKFNFFITIIPAIFLIFLSQYIVKFYGESFINMRPVLIVGLFASVFSSIGNVFSQLYISVGNTWELLFIRIFRDGGISLTSFLLILNSNGEMAAFYLSSSLLFFHILASSIMFFRHRYKAV